MGSGEKRYITDAGPAFMLECVDMRLPGSNDICRRSMTILIRLPDASWIGPAIPAPPDVPLRRPHAAKQCRGELLGADVCIKVPG